MRYDTIIQQEKVKKFELCSMVESDQKQLSCAILPRELLMIFLIYTSLRKT